MTARLVVVACALGLARAQPGLSVPSITAGSGGVTVDALSGDVLIKTGAAMCTSAAPCALGATLSDMQASITSVNTTASQLSATCALSIDVAATYLTQSDAQSTYAPAASLASYQTVADAVAMNQATRLYVDAEVGALANLTNTSVADIIQATRNLGMIHENGTFYASITVNSDADLVNMALLLDHVVEIRGDLYLQSLQSLTSFQNGLFSNLRTVGGNLYVNSNQALSTLSGAFPALTSVGGNLYVNSNRQLTSLDGAFANLTTVGGVVGVQSNPLLASLGNAFPQLTTIGQVLLLSNNQQLGASVGQAFARLRSVAGSDLGSDFSAATMVLVGDVYYYPGQSRSLPSLQAAATMLQGKRLVTGNIQVYYATSSDGSSLPANFASDVRMVGGQVYVYYCQYFTNLDNAFPNLVSAGGVYIYRLTQLRSMSNAFPNLRVVAGSLTFSYQQSSGFTSMANIFPNLVNVTGSLNIQYNTYVQTMDGAFARLQWVGTYVYLYYNQYLRTVGSAAFPALTYTGGIRFYRNAYTTSSSATNQLSSLNGAFPVLTTVGRNGLYIYYEYGLRTLQNAFPQLTVINSDLYMYYNYNLQSVSGSFNALVNMTGYFRVYYNPQMNSISGAFASLRSLGGLYWYAMGSTSNSVSGQQAWCNNVRARLCPLTSVYVNSGWNVDADNCCNDYCQSNSC